MKKIVINNDNRRFNISSIVVGYLEENKEEVLEFEIPEKYAEYGKKACFNANGQKFAKIFDDINGSTLTFTRDITKYKELEMSIEFFKIENEDEIIARTSNLHIIIENAVICDDDISPDEPKIIILDKLIDEVTKVGLEVEKKGDYAKEQGDYAKSQAENVISANTEAIKIINNFENNVEAYTTAFNENANNKTTDFDSNANSKTETYNNNHNEKLNAYNTNATSKINDYNTNASTKLQEYNTNADNKIAEYDLHSQELNNKIVSTRNELERVKNDVLETGTDTDTYIHLEDSAMAEYQELSVDGVCKQETTSIANGDEYDSPSPDHPQPISVIENSLKITSCNKNLFDKDNIISGYRLDSKGNLYREYGYNTSDFIRVKSNTQYFRNITISQMECVCIYNEKKEFIKRLQSGKSITTNNEVNYIRIVSKDENLDIMQVEENTQSTSYEQHLETQITVNLPEGEFIGKLDDTYKDTLKVEYNETDGQYHLNLYKRVYKNNSYNGESYNYYISTTARKDGNIECGELQTGQVVYYDGDETIIDLGIVDQLITYNEVTNLFTDSNLLPTINAKYYRNFITTIQNLQVNEKALKQELIDINTRLSALESAQTNVVSESEVIE